MSRAWNTGELKVLRMFSELGAEQVALLLDRSVGSVQSKAKELRVSLITTGNDVNVEGAGLKLLQRIRETPGLTICPLCGQRLATMKATGICRVCHLDQLITLREVQLLETARERRLTQLRQEKRRLRVCAKCGRPFFPRVGSEAAACGDCGGGQ